jgi:transcription antitermination protein NusB
MTDAAAGRRQARRVAMILLYQHDVTGRPLEELYETYERDAGAPVPPYARDIADAISADPSGLDVLIGEHAHGWTIERISPIERAALRIATFEMAERSEVPAAVAISEAVRLVKRYASPEAATFVNGILGAIARALGVGK